MRGDRRGFTLIELLVAMAVLAVLSVLGFRGLNSVLDAQARVQAESRRWSDVSLLVSQMSQDVAMAVDRQVRDHLGRLSPAMIVRPAQTDLDDPEAAQLVFTRLGRGDGATTQESLGRVGYRLRDGTLEYVVWPALDPAPGTAPIAEPALHDVSELRFDALDQDGAWHAGWPAGGSGNALPRAVAVQIAFASGERVTRIFPLR